MPPWLLLDEPERHLDLPARAVLQSALAEYLGAVVQLSHSPRLLRALAANRQIDLARRQPPVDTL